MTARLHVGQVFGLKESEIFSVAAATVPTVYYVRVASRV